MKKFLTALLIFIVASSAAHSEQAYDPQHTMLALNMAIVSVHKILTAQDRAVLEQEYNNIINNLSLGNIESDSELTGLYQELMTVITSKRLREDDSKRLQEFYKLAEQRLITYAMSNIKEHEARIKDARGTEKVIAKELPKYESKENWVIGLGAANWITNLALSAIPSFEISAFGGLGKVGFKNNIENYSDTIFDSTIQAYERLERERINSERDLQDAKNEQLLLQSRISALRDELQQDTAKLQQELKDSKWQLERQEIEECDRLQQKLLYSSWNLLRKYRLPDNYRLTQNILKNYYKALSESDPAKRLRMLKVLEDEFRVYPPYWYYRAKAAEESGNDSETQESFKKFAEVWRPVLRKDAYKVEAEKYHVRKLAGDSPENHVQEIMKALDEIRANTQKDDWANNLFAGVALFVMGDHEQGIECLDINVDFEYEQNVSGAVLAQMKKGNLNGDSAQEIVKSLQQSLQLAELTRALADLFDGVTGAQERLEQLNKAANNPAIFKELFIALWGSLRIKQDTDKAQQLLTELAEKGNTYAILVLEALKLQLELEELYQTGMNYYDGRNGVKKDYAKAVEYFTTAAEGGHAEAQYWLGFCYRCGLGVSKDLEKARYWFGKAAEGGHAKAQYSLGDCYRYGRGVSKDLEKARYWFGKAAAQGYPWAKMPFQDMNHKELEELYQTGWNYYIGGRNGVKEDEAKAVEYFTTAAEGGHAEAQYNLGNWYRYGRGVSKDLEKARYWYEKAAALGDQGDQSARIALQDMNHKELEELYQTGLTFDDPLKSAFNRAKAVEYFTTAAEGGHAEAQYKLGDCYKWEWGVSKDLEKARYWYGKAAAQGHQYAKYALQNMNE